MGKEKRLNWIICFYALGESDVDEYLALTCRLDEFRPERIQCFLRIEHTAFDEGLVVAERNAPVRTYEDAALRVPVVVADVDFHSFELRNFPQ